MAPDPIAPEAQFLRHCVYPCSQDHGQKRVELLRIGFDPLTATARR